MLSFEGLAPSPLIYCLVRGPTLSLSLAPILHDLISSGASRLLCFFSDFLTPYPSSTAICAFQLILVIASTTAALDSRYCELIEGDPPLLDCTFSLSLSLPLSLCRLPSFSTSLSCRNSCPYSLSPIVLPLSFSLIGTHCHSSTPMDWRGGLTLAVGLFIILMGMYSGMWCFSLIFSSGISFSLPSPPYSLSLSLSPLPLTVASLSIYLPSFRLPSSLVPSHPLALSPSPLSLLSAIRRDKRTCFWYGCSMIVFAFGMFISSILTAVAVTAVKSALSHVPKGELLPRSLCLPLSVCLAHFILYIYHPPFLPHFPFSNISSL